MAILNPKFMLAPSPQVLFRDKVSGAPLRNGKVYFYKDTDRTPSGLKSIYKLTGSPADYSYEALPNPVTLSSIGTMMDDNDNDIIPYYFPYDGDAETTTGEVELYYIRVYNQDGVFQWDRQGWPNLSVQDVESQDVKNFIPNGQFLFHNDIPVDHENSKIAGQIREEVTELAQGGWQFIQRPQPSTAETIVTFELQEPLTNPTSNPRYELVVEVKDLGNISEQNIRIKFNDVNKFASPSQQYTYYFEAESDNGQTANATIYLIKNYGTDGDPETEEQIGQQITIGTSFSSFNIHIPFGTNSGKVIGPLNDDFVAIDIRLENELQKIKITNAALIPNAVEIEEFPQETDADMKTRGIAGWMPTPNPDGSDLYLPLRLTKSGMAFDYSKIGKIEQCAYYLTDENKAIDINQLYCDGSGYPAYGYSDVGIPYRRLHTKLYDSTAKIPIFGCGLEYMDAYISELTPASEVRFSTNKAGSTTVINANTSGMIVKTVHTGMSLNLKSYKADADSLYAIGTVIGSPVEVINVQTSGFIASAVTYPGAPQIFAIDVPNPASGMAGKYFTFSNTTTKYYLWFKVAGVGIDPAPATYTSAGFIDLDTNYTAANVADCVREALNGGQISTITAIAASSITAGNYFTVYSNSGSEKTFKFWLKKDGAGTAPTGGIPIEVEITNSDTAAQVADKIRVANNRAFVGVPDFRNLFLRGYANPATWDYEPNFRISNKSALYGNNIGTIGFSNNLSHTHAATSSVSPPSLSYVANVPGIFANLGPELNTATYTPTVTTTITAEGGPEARPINAYVNFVINY